MKTDFIEIYDYNLHIFLQQICLNYLHYEMYQSMCGTYNVYILAMKHN